MNNKNRTVPFTQVDVFTRRRFHGNPVAIVLDAVSLSDAEMQRIAHWTNLSETVFVLPVTHPEASYRIRIFTPQRELAFAGHPSIGAAHALLEHGLIQPRAGELIQECIAGLLPLRVENDDGERRISVRAQKAVISSPNDAENIELARALRATPLVNPKPAIVYNGSGWWVAGFASAAQVRALRPDLTYLAMLTRRNKTVSVAVYGIETEGDTDLAVRCFAPADGIPEDPVTGSGNAAIAAFLARHGQLPATRYRSSQGRELGRDGLLQMHVDGDDVWVGGAAVTIIDGMIRLDA